MRRLQDGIYRAGITGSCQVGGTAALRTHEAALVDGGIIGAAAEVVQGDVEKIREGNENIVCRFPPAILIVLQSNFADIYACGELFLS